MDSAIELQIEDNFSEGEIRNITVGGASLAANTQIKVMKLNGVYYHLE